MSAFSGSWRVVSVFLLCLRDSRLGFHSEAEGYKYYLEKIRWRMRQLRKLLGSDFNEVEKLFRAGKPLFPEYTGAQPSGAEADAIPSDESVWSSPDLIPPSNLRWQPCTYGPANPAVRWGTSYDGRMLYMIVSGAAGAGQAPAVSPTSVLVKVEPRRFWPAKHFVFMPGAEWSAELPHRVAPRIPLANIGLSAEQLHPIRVDVRIQGLPAGTVAWRLRSSRGGPPGVGIRQSCRPGLAAACQSSGLKPESSPSG